MCLDQSRTRKYNWCSFVGGLPASLDFLFSFVFLYFRSMFEEPNCDEGFEEIVKVNFIPTFKEERVKELYRQFLYEGLPAEYFWEADN